MKNIFMGVTLWTSELVDLDHVIQEFSQIASRYNIFLNVNEIVKNVEQTYDSNEAGKTLSLYTSGFNIKS